MITVKKKFILNRTQLAKKFRVENNNLDITALIDNTGFSVKKIGEIENYPNPFNPFTTIKYQLPNPSEVTLTVYNVIGQVIRTLVDEKQMAGYYSIQWDGKDETGQTVASGVYLYCLKTKDFVKSLKTILLR